MEENTTLLILDDDLEILRCYQHFLGQKQDLAATRSLAASTGSSIGGTGPTMGCGYQLLCAQTADEAVDLVRSEIKAGRRVAAGFFDVRLGAGNDGLAAILAIKGMDKDFHCVIATAYDDRTLEEIHQIFGEGFKNQWGYLSKPFNRAEVVQKARQMIASWNAFRRLEFLTQQLVQAEKLASIGQVARGVRHEFGNILQRIIGKVDLALMETNLEKMYDHLKVIMKAAERAGAIVKNLQSYTKSEPNLQIESIVVPLEEAISLVDHEMARAAVEIIRQYQDVPKLKMDVGGLAQVFLNLMINSLHAMPEGGKLFVTVDQANGGDGASGIIVKIADTGTGIPAYVLPHIFDFAFSTKGNQGSGLGLSVSKDIIEASGGKIAVQTETGRGTEFSIWLPHSSEGQSP